MDNNSVQRLKDLLGQSQKIAIAVGYNPTVDEMAAALSLSLSLQATGKTAPVVSPSEPIVELSNLVGIDRVKTSYEGGEADLVVSFPYKEGEIEKVSYTIENGFLNIVVKAGEQGLSFSERDVRYIRGGGSGGNVELLFVVGTPRFGDISALFPSEALRNTQIVNVDNKSENEGFGDIVLVSPGFSSVSEQIAQLIAYLDTPPDVDIAQNLLDGIMNATGDFQSPRTSFVAFETAAMLMRNGAKRRGAQPQQPQQPRQRVAQPAQMQRPAPQPRVQPQVDRVQQPYPNTPQPQAAPQPRIQPQPQQPKPSLDDQNPPTDWLTPKVYKGSSNV